MSRLEDENAFSDERVHRQPQIRSCTSFILVIWFLGISLDSSCNAVLRAWMFLGASIIYVGPFVRKCPNVQL